MSQTRGWLDLSMFVALLSGWVLGLVMGRELHGFIHILLLAAVYVLIKNIGSHTKSVPRTGGRSFRRL